MKNKATWMRIVAVMLTLIMLVGVFSACAKSDAETPAQDNDAMQTEQSNDTQQEETPAQDEGKDTLTVAYGSDQGTVPWVLDGQSSLSYANLYDTLFTYDDNMQLVPNVAESYEISEDGTVYTLKIREGILFHNGEELVAEDVAWSVQYIYDNSDWGYALMGNYDHVDVVDEYTVNVVLTEAFGPFIKALASRACYICDKSYFDEVGAEGYEAAPIGSGPYKFVSAESGVGIKLEAFDDYMNGAPKIKNLYIRVIPDSNAQMVALEAGQIDAIVDPAMSMVVNMNNENLDWVWGDATSRTMFSINVDPERPLGDLNLRKALQCVVNRADILLAVNEGYGSIADICMLPSYSGYPKEHHVVEEDVEMAKEYLANSSYNGEKIVMVCPSGSQAEQIANVFQAQCYEIGINIEVSAVDTATCNDIRANGEYDMMGGATNSSLLDCDVCYATYGPSSTINWFEYSDKLNELCTLGRTTSDDAAREAIYQELADVITDEALEITFLYNIVTLAYNNSLKTPVVNALNMYDFSTWEWIA